MRNTSRLGYLCLQKLESKGSWKVVEVDDTTVKTGHEDMSMGNNKNDGKRQEPTRSQLRLAATKQSQTQVFWDEEGARKLLFQETWPLPLNPHPWNTMTYLTDNSTYTRSMEAQGSPTLYHLTIGWREGNHLTRESPPLGSLALATAKRKKNQTRVVFLSRSALYPVSLPFNIALRSVLSN